MRIGMTYDLLSDYLALGWSEEDAAEFDSERTINAIECALKEMGHDVERIGRGRELARRLVAGERWDLVFNFCEGTTGRGREALVPALLEEYGIPYTFCDPLTACVTLDKAAAKRIVRDAGLPTPRFHVVSDIREIEKIALPFPLFAKPLSEGTGKGVDGASIIRDASALKEVCARLLERFKQPVLIEEFLPGREVTVGIIGSGEDAEVAGVMEVKLLEQAEKDVYSYVNKHLCAEKVEYRLADPSPFRDEAAALALASYRVLEARDAGRVDIRADAKGRASFIEINPLAGLNPGYSDLCILYELGGGTYNDLIRRIVESALRRVRK